MERIETKSVSVEVERDAGLLIQRLDTLCPESGGCVLELVLALEDVPPETRTAVALTVTELDQQDREYPRGLRTLLVHGHHESLPVHLAVPPVRFVIPAELDLSGGGKRRFLVRVDANYVDCHARCRLLP